MASLADQLNEKLAKRSLEYEIERAVYDAPPISEAANRVDDEPYPIEKMREREAESQYEHEQRINGGPQAPEHAGSRIEREHLLRELKDSETRDRVSEGDADDGTGAPEGDSSDQHVGGGDAVSEAEGATGKLVRREVTEEWYKVADEVSAEIYLARPAVRKLPGCGLKLGSSPELEKLASPLHDIEALQELVVDPWKGISKVGFDQSTGQFMVWGATNDAPDSVPTEFRGHPVRYIVQDGGHSFFDQMFKGASAPFTPEHLESTCQKIARNRNELPYRNRVEVVITDGLNVYFEKHPLSEGGGWFPGGGVDYGEKFADAAAREAVEETGISVEDIRRYDVPAIECIWDPEADSFVKERANVYRGDRTFFYIANAKSEGKATTDEDDEMDGEWLPLATVRDRLGRGRTLDHSCWKALTRVRYQIMNDLAPKTRKAPRRG